MYFSSNTIVTILFTIGQRGLYTRSSGLQLAYLSGCYEESEYIKIPTDNTILVSIYYTHSNIYSIEYMYIHVPA